MPTEKRARHKAARQARMAELRRAQQRRRNLRRGGVVAAIVVIAVVLALVTSLNHGGSKTKTSSSSVPKSSTTTAASTTTTSTTPPTTVPVSSVKPLSLSALEANLKPLAPPAKSLACNAPEKASGSTTTTTVPAKGKAVSIVAAPPGVGFPKLNGSSPRYTKFTAAPPFCINVNDTYTATMKTTAGTIVLRLLPKYAPVTVNSFVFLAGYHYFNGIVFHRVIPGFVDQGGDPTGTGSGGPGYTIPDEYPKNDKAYDAGSLAMANTGTANTGGSQFFIVVGDGGSELQPKYTVFGQIVSGLDVANKINAGGGTLADSGVPPKILYKIKSVTITVTKGSGASKSTTSTTAKSKTTTTTTAKSSTSTAKSTSSTS